MQRHPVEAGSGQGDVEPERQIPAAAPAHAQEAHPLVLKASRHERERALGRVVKPLGVVDRKQRRRVGRQGLQHPEQAEADSPLQRLLPLGLGAQQRHLERTSLRRGQIGHGGLGDICEQIAERRVGHLRLALARAAAEDALPVGGSRDQALVEERRLSDARLALDQQRSGTGADRAEEFLHAFELGVAAYERAHLHGVRHCPSPGRPILRPGDSSTAPGPHRCARSFPRRARGRSGAPRP